MVKYNQGDIIKIEGQKNPVLVVSKSIYNQSGQVIVCPMIKEAMVSPIIYKVEFEKNTYSVLVDQVKKFDLSVRGSKQLGCVTMKDIVLVSDLLQALFEY